ncbi:hypothetical protein G7054_g15029 [Neopestalotiopsis clavispora]|nr:hypothetical protein G7054_g15029 [Neopestalotiopsis clavispora]
MTTSIDAQQGRYSHLNGSTADLLERFAVSELCKGWPVYRDSSEWKNYRDIFDTDATVWTTWSKGRSVDDFIAISKQGKDKGDFIMHRECGTLVEYAPEHNRAIGKMKATITQRFKTPASLATADCPPAPSLTSTATAASSSSAPRSGPTTAPTAPVVVPVDGVHAPMFPRELLDSFPEGYSYLGAAQSMLGYPVTKHLPTAQDHKSWFAMYAKMEEWLAGKDVDLLVDDDDSVDHLTKEKSSLNGN